MLVNYNSTLTPHYINMYILLLLLSKTSTTLLQATNYTHYYYYYNNNNTFFFFYFFLPHASLFFLFFFPFKPFVTRYISTLLLLFFLFTVPENHATLILFIYFFSTSIHLSNQNLSISINKSNYVHKFLIFLTYKLIKSTLIKIEIF